MTTPKLVLSSPADILAVVPYLVGFHPADSLVVIGFTGPSLALSTRWDLPAGPGDLDRLAPLFVREGVTMAVLAGYGPEPVVDSAVLEAGRLLEAAGVRVTEALRAEDGRYWSYTCPTIVCCPDEGLPYDPVSSPVAAEAVVHGLVALPDRGSLRRSVEPSAAAAMREVSRAVAGELRARLARQGQPDDAIAAEFVAGGVARVRAAIDLYGSGGRLDDRAAARLGFDLSIIRVRDEAWALLDDAGAHLALWKDLTRRLDPRYAAPAASLLAAAAWRSGDCALAGMAVERALEADGAYSMAHLLRDALIHMLSPASLLDRMPTPDELAAEMGPPRGCWLAPLVTWLSDEPSARAG
ncbi:DUF4192 domain-containing protein [Planotetraspora kaengkrachanensis]|nr:DUF4192 domain-containing protein [Planotetraspora kaengkrachanensis]